MRPARNRTGERDGSYSQSLERGLAILSAFRSGRPLLGVSDLGREVGLSRSTTHRYVSTLASLGYLQQLSDETGYTVNMAILDDTDIVYIERCRSTRTGQREIDLNLHVGSRLPAYCTSMGKVLLAYLPTGERDALLGRIELRQRGPNTLIARRALVAELERVRAQGFAINNEELAFGLRSIAGPVFSQTSEIAAAINLAVHSSMVVSMGELVARLSGPLKRTAAEISAHIGYRPTA